MPSLQGRARVQHLSVGEDLETLLTKWRAQEILAELLAAGAVGSGVEKGGEMLADDLVEHGVLRVAWAVRARRSPRRAGAGRPVRGARETTSSGSPVSGPARWRRRRPRS